MKNGIKIMAFAYWIITVVAVSVLLNAGVLEARNLRELAGIPNGIIPKTSFTCREKDAGYYADIETDCQVYHLCDEQGRQYSYACPNATLFQQRMLICDHWYMVDCSAAEASYGFNRLIGQRDQPFVSESDAEKRTPRPDLLDRPYAPDYGGESFRKQLDKSQIPALQNAISGINLSKNHNKKYEILETEASSNILPPQIDSNSLDPTLLPASEDFPQYDKTNDRRAALSAESEEVKTKGFNPPPTGFEPPKLLPTYNDQFRQTEERRLRDLGVPTQPTRTKNSQSFSSIQSVVQSTKKPSKTFDPDKNFAAFDHFFPSGKATHKDYDFSKYLRRDQIATTRKPSTTRRPIQNNQFQPIGPPATQKPAPFVNSNNNRNLLQKAATTTTTRRPAFAATTANVARVIATTKAPVTAKQTFATTKKPSPVTQQPNFFNNQLTQPSARAQLQQKQQQPALNQKSVIVPVTNLLPPLEVVKLYDDATTRGPPVYFDWKLPDNGLVPPKFDNETDTNSLKRSVLEEGNFDNSNDFQSSETRRTGSGNSIKIQYKDLQRYFAIPQVEFPLESSGRDGYEKDDAVNSFQVKIPWRTGNAKTPTAERYFYLEHAHCNPECHPYFFKPGRCEPCIKL